jgi:hypothetical protein
MSYNPGIYYNPAPILAGAMAGAEGLSRGLQSAGQSISAGMIGGAQKDEELEKEHKKTTEELDFLGASAETLQKQGAITLEDLQKFNSGSIGSKRAIVSSGGSKLHQDQKAAEQAAEFANAQAVAKINHPNQAPFSPKAIPITDPKDPNKVMGYALTTSNNSAMPFNPPSPLGEGQAPIEEITTESGDKFYRDARTGKWLPRSAIANPPATNPKPGLMDIQRGAIAKQIADNQTQIDEYIAEAAKGNKKSGPDWMPWVPTFSDKATELTKVNANLENQLSMLGKGSSQAVEAPTGPLRPGAAGEKSSGQKKLTPQIALEFYNKAGGDEAKAKQLAKEAGY